MSRKLTGALLLVLLGLSVYRARVQSFTIDEAWVFNLYVSKPLGDMVRYYDAANHVLHTLLMKVAYAAFGMGELGLRLPTLIGTALYLLAVYRITTLLFSSWMQVLAAAVMTMHPLVLDFFVAARGYGLALALFTWAVYYSLWYSVGGLDRRALWRAGIAGGLAVGANLTFAVPVAALGCALLLVHRRERVSEVVDGYGGPAIVSAFLIVVLPLASFDRIALYYGVPGLGDTIRGTLDSVGKRDAGAVHRVWMALLPFLERAGIPLLVFLLAGAAGIAAARKRESIRFAPVALVCGTLSFSVLIVVAMHLFLGTPYPLTRTGLYFIPLFGLALMTTAIWRSARPWSCAIALLLVFAYALLNDNRYFGQWRFDASTLTMIRAMTRDWNADHPSRAARIATNPLFKQTVLFYKAKRNMTWLAGDPVTENLSAADADYFLLLDNVDTEVLQNPALQVIAHDHVTRAVLARKR